MRIYVRVKTPGKRRDVLAPVAYSLPEGIDSLRKLLTELTRQEVERYNRKDTETQQIPFLTDQELLDQAEAGKVGFGRLWSDKKADPKKAVDNVLQCWQDGLIRVFLSDAELTELDAPLQLQEEDQLTFLRLTFLSGRMW